ncbi:unnamed protein product [Haemonchus placei]|uniref:Uncharacterized protein n=1 Tax=Haemonchus placei TaxID=6290 RepID=A0A3P7VYK4_HAEPC|nr:unnamed protein product [Haemonchus placei]
MAVVVQASGDPDQHEETAIDNQAPSNISKKRTGDEVTIKSCKDLPMSRDYPKTFAQLVLSAIFDNPLPCVALALRSY